MTASERLRQRWQDPAFRARMIRIQSETMTRMNQDAAFQAKAADGRKRCWRRWRPPSGYRLYYRKLRELYGVEIARAMLDQIIERDQRKAA